MMTMRALLREARPYVASAKGDDTETLNFVDGLLRDIDAALAQSDAEPVRAFLRKHFCVDGSTERWINEEAEALYNSLVQSDAEPVKYEYRRHKGMGNWIECGKANYNANSEYEYRALYTAPPRPDAQTDAEPVTWQKVREVLDAARLCLKSRDQSPQEARVREAIESILYTAPPRPDASAGLIEAAEWHDAQRQKTMIPQKIMVHRVAADYFRARAADRSGK